MSEIERNNVETISDESTELLKEKLWCAWGSARDQLKVPNLHRTAELLYKSLYSPDSITSEEVIDMPEFNRLHFLKEPLPTKFQPEEKEFIEAVRHAMTKEADFEKCLYPGAQEVIARLSAIGPVTIWTRGDVAGVDDSGYSGSHEQVKKVAYSGLNDLRKTTAQERGLDSHHEVFSLAAGENKFDLVPDIVKRYREEGVDTIIILEDLVKNIIRASEIVATESDMTVYPVWVRQGLGQNSVPKNSTESVEQWAEKLHAAESLSQVIEKLQSSGLLKEGTGAIIDYDNVLSNDETRKEVQFEAVLNKLQSKGWV